MDDAAADNGNPQSSMCSCDVHQPIMNVDVPLILVAGFLAYAIMSYSLRLSAPGIILLTDSVQGSHADLARARSCPPLIAFMCLPKGHVDS